MATAKKTYSQLLDDIEQLKQQAELVRRTEIGGVIARIKAEIAFYSLTEEDLGFRKRAAKTSFGSPPPAPVPAKKKKRKSRYTERPLAGARR